MNLGQVSLASIPYDQNILIKFTEQLVSEGVSVETSMGSSKACSSIILLSEFHPELFSHIKNLLDIGCDHILVVAHNSACKIQEIYEILKSGVSDILLSSNVFDVIPDLIARLKQWAVVNKLTSRFINKLNIIGNARKWRLNLRNIVEASKFSTSSILIHGETGTGKEKAAELAWSVISGDRHIPFTIVDCASIVPSLSGSELFGHERGAFTGATSARDGALANVDGGVLFLDEIGELPMELQPQFLRVLQEKTYKRVGGNSWKKVDFRLISATNRDLVKEVETGVFRRDLYYRIAGTCVTLPPLRERREDILSLAKFFLKVAINKDAAPELDDALSAYLIERDYPGNIRDLRQLCMNMAGCHQGSTLFSLGDLKTEEFKGAENTEHQHHEFSKSATIAVARGMNLKEIKEIAANAAILAAKQWADGNIAKAASRLGVTPRALQLRQQKNGSK